MKQLLKVVAALVVIIGLAALASYTTTSIIWDGGFPSGEFRLHVVDPQGQPVNGAVLRVYERGTHDAAYEYPLDNYLPGQELMSDEKGSIVALRKSGGMQFGGDAWTLFWAIPMGDKSPEYDCEITASGYHKLRFPIDVLFETPFHSYDQFPKTYLEADGKHTEVRTYENTVTLER